MKTTCRRNERRAGREGEKEEGGQRGQPTSEEINQAAEKLSDLRGSAGFSQINRTICACMRGQYSRGPSDARQKALCLLTDQCASLYISLSPMIEGDGLFSFNSKLAVLVSEPDLQIKKVRHAHLILVNLPLHISPACQLLCDSNHHRHMPLLCAPL